MNAEARLLRVLSMRMGGPTEADSSVGASV